MKLHLIAAALLCAAPLGVYADQAEDRVVDELRAGLMDHDSALFSSTVERGADLSLELLFKSPSWLQWAFAPRPNIGLSLNSNSGTNVLHFGSAWQIPFATDFFGEGNVALAFNDGEKNAGRDNKRQVGCSVGFYESVSVGYKFLGHHQIMTTADHSSNAGICPPNSGLTSIGLRYGYNF
jgi:lipid A 3-O-deacylase